MAPSDLTLLALMVGAVLLLKKLPEMNRYYLLRVIFLNVLFGSVVIYLLLTFTFTIIRLDNYCVLVH
jgi:hypothetical protein